MRCDVVKIALCIFTNPAILISDELKAASTSYLQNDEIASELQQISTNNIESTMESSEDTSKLGEEPKPPNFLYLCYYCGKGNGFQTNDETDYTLHVISKHGLGHPCYPCKLDLERLGIKAQGKSWEI
jgi:hypothetical protein